MSDELRTLEDCRRRLDQLDSELLRLLSERARVSLRVGELKAGDGSPVYAPHREAEIFERLARQNAGPLPEEALRHIWTEILSSSRALQRRLRVAFLGPVGTFSEEAARRRFGATTELVPCVTLPEVVMVTARRDADYGIVPIENSTDGGIAPVLDTLVEAHVKVCAELELPVSHNLCSPGTLDTIDTVYSIPTAVAQCRRWLNGNLPRAQIVEVTSTARAVEMARRPNEAGIGSELASEAHGVPIVARHIEDNRNNFTRFLVIGDHVAPRTGRDKTSVVFGVRHRPGTLHDALRIFAENGLNLTRIESRPSKRELWEYVFFLDFQGHKDDAAVQKALDQLADVSVFVKVLGSWPDEGRAARGC